MVVRKSNTNSSISRYSSGHLIKIDSYVKNKRDNLILSIFYELGLTISELIDLNVSQIDLVSQSLFLKNNRILNFSVNLRQKLSSYYNQFSPTKYLFYTRQSEQLTARRIQQIVKDFSKQSNQELTPCKIRREKIISLIETGISIDDIKDFTGLKRLKHKEFLSKEEFYEIYSKITNLRDKILCSLFFQLGITLYQAANLKVSQINLKKKIIELKPDGRSSNKKIVYRKFSSILFELLLDYISKLNLSFNDYLFSSRQSGQISHRRIEQILKSYSTKLTPRILRNSFISNALIDSNISDLEVSLGLKELRFYDYASLGLSVVGNSSSDGGDNDRSS